MTTNFTKPSNHPEYSKRNFARGIKVLLVFVFSILTCFPVFSQRGGGFTDNFDDGSMESASRGGNQGNRAPIKIWKTVTPGTYNLVEKDSVLKIGYSRKEGVGAFDRFTWTALRAVNVTSNPRIQVQIKSNIETRLTVSPTYSLEPPTFEFLNQDISGDNAWHIYNFDLTRAYYSSFNNVSVVDFYFDRDTSVTKSGLIEMDNFKIGWYLIKVIDLKAVVDGGTNIRLNWKTSDSTRTGSFRIYRNNTSGFKPEKSNLLTEVKTTSFVDKNLDPFKHYFYKVVAVSTSGEEFFASEETNGETFKNGVAPAIKIIKTNTSTVKKYEKFEVLLDLKNVGIENPYDPADIDVYAFFTTPSGKKIKINGFYDNYREVNQWKLRFSPNETGEYKYQVFVKDAGGTGETSVSKFTAVESNHHGWIKPSVKNPHYFSYDDGTSYYGVGVYSPWGNDQSRFDTYSKNNANLFAIWDIDYGGFVNDEGLIENELGRYNQPKLGEIDSMLSILEKDDIKLMYAIWPHDLFSETVWAAVWKKNPYSKLIDVENVYSDSLIWEYQKQKYRYLIARFAHSRSWGIWELINEMNGTDGWAMGRHQECLDWVSKSDKYFEENDPYNHPTTASFSGGFTEYREELYKRNDIPNIHMYPAQGWVMKYPEDKMRSDMYNYAWASKRFWDAFEKPAIFGESGASLEYFQPRDNEYHIHYHNTLWAALTNGLSATPVWWDYPVLNANDWIQLKNLSTFVSDIDVANLPFKPSGISSDGADVFALDTKSKAFGWVRSFTKEDVSGSVINFKGLESGNYEVTWFDTWKGEYFKTEKIEIKNGVMVLTVPILSEAKLDVAFKVNKK